jgi:nicotinamidase-related amidase
MTNGGVASTVRDSHMHDIDCVVIEDGCAAFSTSIHQTAIEALRPLGRVTTIAEMLAEIGVNGALH